MTARHAVSSPRQAGTRDHRPAVMGPGSRCARPGRRSVGSRSRSPDGAKRYPSLQKNRKIQGPGQPARRSCIGSLILRRRRGSRPALVLRNERSECLEGRGRAPHHEGPPSRRMRRAIPLPSCFETPRACARLLSMRADSVRPENQLAAVREDRSLFSIVLYNEFCNSRGSAPVNRRNPLTAMWLCAHIQHRRGRLCLMHNRPRTRSAPSPLAGEGWGGGSLS
jgi:hypothetical protein